LEFRHGKTIGSFVGHAIMNFILYSVFNVFKNYVANSGFSSIQTIDLKVIIGIGSLFGIGFFTAILLNQLKNYVKRKKENTLEIDKCLSNNKTRTISNTKKLGSPSIVEGIKKYENRDYLPKLNQLIANANKTVDMSALSYYLMILDHVNVIKKALKKGTKFTLLILDTNSKEVEKYSQTLEDGKYLKQHINSVLKILCELKKELKNKDNLMIKTYDSFQKHNIIIIDKDTEYALVKVEYYIFDNPETRANKLAYKVDNPDFYESSLTDYKELLEKSKDYIC
jgi:hypothetical protein